MTVRELINELSKCDLDSVVSVVVGDDDDNIVDTSNFEIHGKDTKEFIELFVHKEFSELRKYVIDGEINYFFNM